MPKKLPNLAGLKARSKSRITKTTVSIYVAEEQGMCSEGGKYAVVCEDHGTCINVDTLAQAKSILPYPDFCDACNH